MLLTFRLETGNSITSDEGKERLSHLFGTRKPEDWKEVWISFLSENTAITFVRVSGIMKGQGGLQ